jgi:PhoPQ-activated pathogenicity-related protein
MTVQEAKDILDLYHKECNKYRKLYKNYWCNNFNPYYDAAVNNLVKNIIGEDRFNEACHIMC